MESLPCLQLVQLAQGKASPRSTARQGSMLLSEHGKMENIPLQAQSDLSQLPSLPAAFHVAMDHPSKAVLRQTRTPACGAPGSAAAWNKSLRSALGLARHARVLQSHC